MRFSPVWALTLSASGEGRRLALPEAAEDCRSEPPRRADSYGVGVQRCAGARRGLIMTCWRRSVQRLG
jgi:hypothetical protein